MLDLARSTEDNPSDAIDPKYAAALLLRNGSGGHSWHGSKKHHSGYQRTGFVLWYIASIGIARS
jgi:hypothetical protein